MKVTIELEDHILWAIAKKQGEIKGYDWSCDNQDYTVNDQYAAAFEDGMRYMLDLIDQQSKEKED